MISVIGSAYRTGTQWMAEMLNDIFMDMVTVKHEPRGNGYLWRDVADPRLQEHWNWIKEQQEQNQDYIEVGWQSYKVVDKLRSLADDFRLVIVARDPIVTALSASKIGLDLYADALGRWTEVYSTLLNESSDQVFKAEDLWTDDAALQGFVNRLDLPWRTSLWDWQRRKVDKWARANPVPFNKNHIDIALADPRVRELAEKFGYDLEEKYGNL